MKDDKLYLIHLSESITKIETYLEGFDYTAFMQSTWCRTLCYVICRSSQNQPSACPTISKIIILK